MLSLLGALAVAFGPRLFSQVSSADGELLTRLKRSEMDGLSLEVRGAKARLVSQRHHYDRVVVDFDAANKVADVSATLDFDGQLGSTKVSSLGLERIRFRYTDEGWVATEGLAPELTAALSALEERRDALERGDFQALSALMRQGDSPAGPELEHLLALTARSYTARAWYLRADRDRFQVTEEFRLQGALPGRPVDELGTRSLVLKKENGRFSFAGSLL